MLIRVFKIIRESQVVSLIRAGAKLCSRLAFQGRSCLTVSVLHLTSLNSQSVNVLSVRCRGDHIVTSRDRLWTVLVSEEVKLGSFPSSGCFQRPLTFKRLDMGVVEECLNALWQLTFFILEIGICKQWALCINSSCIWHRQIDLLRGSRLMSPDCQLLVYIHVLSEITQSLILWSWFDSDTCFVSLIVMFNIFVHCC